MISENFQPYFLKSWYSDYYYDQNFTVRHSPKLRVLRIQFFERCFKHKGALSGLRQNLTTESPLKMMNNAFYFTLKALFVLKMFKLLSWLFGHVLKRLGWKNKVNLEIYDVTAWLRNNCNIHILQYLKK